MSDLTVHLQALNLTAIPTSEELRSVYRERLREAHPDRGGSDIEAAAVVLAYKALLPLCDTDEATVLLLGKPLSEYGQGLGPLVNGVTCKVCEGRGYKVVIEERQWVTCPDCSGEAWVANEPCNWCKGTGARDWRGKGKETCPNCEGRGLFLYPKPRPCPRCNKAGVSLKELRRKVMRDMSHMSPFLMQMYMDQLYDTYGKIAMRNQKYYHVCGTCNGVGETRVMNPALPKGRLR